MIKSDIYNVTKKVSSCLIHADYRIFCTDVIREICGMYLNMANKYYTHTGGIWKH